MEIFSKVVSDAVSEIFGADLARNFNVELSRTDEKFGDFSTNVAMTIFAGSKKDEKFSKEIAEKLGEIGAQNPRDLAEKIAEKLREKTAEDFENDFENSEKNSAKIGENKTVISSAAEKSQFVDSDSSTSEFNKLNSFAIASGPLREQNDSSNSRKNTQNSARKIFEKVEIAGAGFINLTISAQNLAQNLDKNFAKSEFFHPEIYKNQEIVTEFSDPNPFKVLHIGHFYTSVVGDSISNLVENSGAKKVHRVNFGGDVGLHVAKNLWAIREFLRAKFGREIDENSAENLDEIIEKNANARADFMAKCYVRGTNSYEENEDARREITEINSAVYEFQKTKNQKNPLAKIYWLCRKWSYDYFDDFYAKIGVKFEKYYPESSVAEIGLEKIRENVPKIYEKSSEGDAIIFAGEKFGLHARVFINSKGLPTYEAKDVGLSFAKWRDYKFDKSIIITGNDIIEYMKVVLKSISLFAPKLAERTLHLTHGNVKLAGGVKMSSRKGNFVRATDVLELTEKLQEKESGAKNAAVVLGAIKFAFLKNDIGPDVIFEPETSVSLVGNSGPYVQYAAVRVNKILRDNAKFLREDNSVRITYFVHGTTTDNENHVATGWNGGALSELGIRQSKDLANQIKDKKFDVIFCSDLKRAVDSAKLNFPDAKIIRDERLRECNYGDFNGTDSAQVVEIDHIEAPFPNGESMHDVENRVQDFCDFLGKNYVGKKVAIVAHKAPQFAFQVIAENRDWAEVIENDWRKTKSWQPGWEYVLKGNYDFAAEKNLILKLLEFPEILRISAEKLEPHRAANYAFELAREFNKYYEKTPVATREVAPEIREIRLNFLAKISNVFEHSLKILGIEIPEKM